MKRWPAVLVLVLSIGVLAGCNTVKGVGKDLQKVGGKLQESADQTGGTGPR